jgi:FixJ family two-component response regulator
MPGMNGLDLSRELLKLRPTQTILLSTGFSGTMTPEGLRKLGIRDLLWKPVTARSLSETVHKALHPDLDPKT